MSCTALSSAEIYDPATGLFTGTGPMNGAHTNHTATLLQDGRVLVVGGRSNDATVQSAEIYDPRARTFGPAGTMTEARQDQAAVLLPDGRVFIAGGLWTDSTTARALSSTEVYDPVGGTFRAAGSMGTPRDGPSATLLQDGRVLIVGGADTGPEGEIGVQSAVLYVP